MDDDFAELADRLRSLSQSPVPAATRGRTLSAMHGGIRPDRRWSRAAVAIAALGGFFMGSLGLASAGALPDSVQDVAHDVLGHVGVNVPVGTQRFEDPSTCPNGPYKNHGDYVKQHKADQPQAAKSECGKPMVSTQHDNSSGSNESTKSSESDDSTESENSSSEHESENSSSEHSSDADSHSSTGQEKKDAHAPETESSGHDSSQSTGS